VTSLSVSILGPCPLAIASSCPYPAGQAFPSPLLPSAFPLNWEALSCPAACGLLSGRRTLVRRLAEHTHLKHRGESRIWEGFEERGKLPKSPRLIPGNQEKWEDGRAAGERRSEWDGDRPQQRWKCDYLLVSVLIVYESQQMTVGREH